MVTFFPAHSHTHTHTNGRALTTQRAGLTIESLLGFSLLAKDISTCEHHLQHLLIQT